MLLPYYKIKDVFATYLLFEFWQNKAVFCSEIDTNLSYAWLSLIWILAFVKAINSVSTH